MRTPTLVKSVQVKSKIHLELKEKDWGPKKAALGLFAASKMGKNKLKKLAMKRASMATPNTYLATQNFNSGKEVKKPKGRMFTAAEVRALDESTGSKVNPKKKERIMQSGDKDKIKLSKTNLKDFNVVAWLEEWVLLLRVVNSKAYSNGQNWFKKWFSEKWVDISAPKKGGGYKECGRKSASGSKENTPNACLRKSNLNDIIRKAFCGCEKKSSK